MSQEDVLLRRLAKCHAEACKEIEASVKAGRSLGDAVLDAIEALPPSKTRDLRRWLEDWEAWEEWERWAKRGYRVRKSGSRVLLTAPKKEYVKYARAERDLTDRYPSNAAVAAAAGVHVLHFANAYDRRKTKGGKWEQFMGIRDEKYIDGETVVEYAIGKRP